MAKRRTLRERQLDTDEAKYDEFCMSDFEAWACLSCIVGVIVVCIFYVAALIQTNGDHSAYLRKVEYATTYNAFTETERKTMFESGIATRYPVDESYLIEIEEEPPTWTEYFIATYKAAIWIAILGGLVIMMICIFCCYRNGKRAYYFYADFPGTPRQRRLLLLGSLIAAPIYFVSYLNMKAWIKAGRTPTNTARVTCEDPNEVLLPKEDAIKADSIENYAQFLHSLALTVSCDELDSLPDQIKRAKERRREAKKAYKKACNEVESLESRRKELEETVKKLKGTDPAYDEAKLADDLMAISQMQGVTRVFGRIEQGYRNVWNYVVHVDIRLRFTYRGEIYDGGDWALTLNSAKDPELLKFTERRSGLLPERQCIKQPYYFDNSGKHFRFGADESTIYEHLKAGEIVEAMKMIMECLHSIPDANQMYIPSCYKRVM